MSTTTDLAVRTPELERFRQLGHWLALSESGADNEKTRGAAGALRLYYADQLGLPPLAAAELSVIRGKLVISARLLRALAGRHGYRVVKGKSSSEGCQAQLLDRNGQILGESIFTLEDAKRAGLIRDKSAWVSHPARMCWARASANVIYDTVPEVALGLITVDEANEIEDRPTPPPDDEIELEVEDEGFPERTETAGGLRTPVGVNVRIPSSSEATGT
jgi:hypothetical protein